MATNGQATVAFKGAGVREGSDVITVRYISHIGIFKEFEVPFDLALLGLLQTLPINTEVTYQSNGEAPPMLVAIDGRPIYPWLS